MAEVDAYLQELRERLIRCLSDDLLGVYLHGSAAMGAFVPSRSDIDVLAVTKSPLSAPAKAAVADALSEESLPCSGIGLEISIVTVDSARTLSETPAFELHLRNVLIHDHADRDAIASRLMRYRDQNGRDWADIIDFLTMYPDARRRVVQLLGELQANADSETRSTRRP